VTEKVATTVPLRWDEAFYTNCPMISANNVDQELGWTKEEFKKIGVEYNYFRSRNENSFYPHYIHNFDNLIRMGGLYPAIHVNADLRRTRLLGPRLAYEGGCMLVRARDDICKMSDLKGKKIGLTKSLNTIKNGSESAPRRLTEGGVGLRESSRRLSRKGPRYGTGN